jgi:hypothetical protein
MCFQSRKLTVSRVPGGSEQLNLRGTSRKLFLCLKMETEPVFETTYMFKKLEDRQNPKKESCVI